MFVKSKEVREFKSKHSAIVATSLCLGTISKDCRVDNRKKTVLNGYFYDFSVGYGAIVVDDILEIDNYLIKKNNIIWKQYLGLLKDMFYKLSIFIGFNKRKLVSCISMNNPECRIRPQILNVNGDNPLFFLFSIKKSKCSGSCNNINIPHAKLCVPDMVKNLNVKVFNQM